MFALEMAMAPRVGLEVSPALVAFSELLSLSGPALEALVESEVRENAALERLEVEGCPICRGGWRARCPVCSTAPRPSVSSPLIEAGERAAPESDAETLLRAVRLEITAREAPIAERLVDSLDEHGRLDGTCAEIADELGVSAAAVESVLAVVRRCGPPGVGARSLPECLLLQLDALAVDDPRARLARSVIAGHLPALARGRFASIARALGVTREEVEAALELIRDHLRPYPAFDGRGAPACTHALPDVVVRAHPEIPDAFTVELVEPSMARLALRRDAGDGSVARARSFLGQLRDRWETLRRVAEYALEHQRAFLLEGPLALQPLTRAETAAALDLHESTVSRAVADKQVLLPDGTLIALARLFGAGGGVDAALRRILETSDGRLSDQRLADRLCEAGYPIARRTVAKHRARLGYTAACLR